MTADLLAVLREAFEAGYIQGHDATVEGRYADPSDAAQDYVRTLLVPAVDERAASSEPEMCPNCVTPWKCNGPHEFPQAASSEAAVALLRKAVSHIAALNGTLQDCADLGMTIAVCGTEYDDAEARDFLNQFGGSNV